MLKIIKGNLTLENIMIIKLIDNSFYKDDKLTLEWYLKRYSDKNIAFFLMNEQEIVVGYVTISNIKKELYDQIKNGNITNDLDIDPTLYDINSKYHYISSIVIKEPYQKLGYGTKLINRAIKECGSNAIALTVSLAGYNLMKKVMTLVMNIDNTKSIFEYRKNLNPHTRSLFIGDIVLPIMK